MFKALLNIILRVCDLGLMPRALGDSFNRLSVYLGLGDFGGVLSSGYNNGILKWVEIGINDLCSKTQNICNVFAMYLTIKYLDCSNLYVRVC
jgi:hypothetical protein